MNPPYLTLLTVHGLLNVRVVTLSDRRPPSLTARCRERSQMEWVRAGRTLVT